MEESGESTSKNGGLGGSAIRWLVGLTVSVCVLFLVSVGSLLWLFSGTERVEVSEGSWMVMRLDGSVVEVGGQSGFSLDTEQTPLLVTDVAMAIERAADDERIEGIFLSQYPGSAGWGSQVEIRDALSTFRAAGKPCIAYAENYDMASYLVASACDRVVMAPGGMSFVQGLSITVSYYAGLFEKVGAEADFEHVGDFKSAVEPYERTGPSDAASEAMEGVLSGLFDVWVESVAEGRGMSVADVRAAVDQGSMQPSGLVASGLIDGVGYRDVVLASLRGWDTEGWAEGLEAVVTEAEAKEAPERTSLSDYVRENKGLALGPKVAVVHASGTIVSGEASDPFFGSGLLGDRDLAGWLRKARKDDRVKAVVLRIDSPGGSGLASDMMWHEIKRTQAEGKPVVVSMANYAASGGYYIAAPADWIVAQPNTLTGSIGVFGGKINLGGSFEKLGMTSHAYKRGEHSDLLSSDRSFSEGGRAIFKGSLESFYKLFLERVAAGRSMTVEDVHKVAQGRVWTGQQAQEAGLVDELGGLTVAVAKAKDLAGIADEATQIVRYPENKTFVEMLLDDLQPKPESDVLMKLGAGTLEGFGAMWRLERVLSEGGVAAMLPGDIDVQ